MTWIFEDFGKMCSERIGETGGTDSDSAGIDALHETVIEPEMSAGLCSPEQLFNTVN